LNIHKAKFQVSRTPTGRHGCEWFAQQYCHPQADAMETAFSKSGNPSEVVTDGGHREK
jgi:hypothetical protein